ncbi:acyl carrier protein [Burkholderia anthinoferrum]|uniref:acyl carrier protein n=1 Tax=Burkholderia anthinoferrum TaxID=3090833 RepID=UPI000CE27902|nr:acyl carrier protein [Burkholderia anthinoferrum]
MATHPVSPSSTSVSETVKACLLSVLGSTLSTDLIVDDTNLFDVGVDSMNMTDLLLQLEQRFGFTLAPEDLSADLFLRFGNLVSFVESHASFD